VFEYARQPASVVFVPKVKAFEARRCMCAKM